MRIRLAIPDRHATAPVLDAALEATTRAATSQMLAGEAPTFSDLLRSGVRWRPEPYTDGEHFDLPPVIAARGWADCDDLAPALAAELRSSQADPGAIARVVRSGPERWHAIVQLSDGTTIDPSIMAGMKSKRGVRGTLARPMAAVGESAIAVAPHGGRWFARTDVPWDGGHIASISSDHDLATAMDRSIVGALSCGAELCWPHATDRTVLGSLYNEIVAAHADPRGLSQRWRTARRSSPVIARF